MRLPIRVPHPGAPGWAIYEADEVKWGRAGVGETDFAHSRRHRLRSFCPLQPSPSRRGLFRTFLEPEAEGVLLDGPSITRTGPRQGDYLLWRLRAGPTEQNAQPSIRDRPSPLKRRCERPMKNEYDGRHHSPGRALPMGTRSGPPSGSSAKSFRPRPALDFTPRSAGNAPAACLQITSASYHHAAMP